MELTQKNTSSTKSISLHIGYRSTGTKIRK